MFESKSGVFLIAGLGFFALAFVSNGLVPILMYSHLEEKKASQLVTKPLLVSLRNLQEIYPESFGKYYLNDDEHSRELFRIKFEPRADEKLSDEEAEELARLQENLAAQAIKDGRRTYIAEGCWHCHSQFVRPVSNEQRRWGDVSEDWEYQNELQRPVMFGTRRVGPDLIRESGRHSVDWHAAHFFRPRDTSANSVMPEYTWFFDGDPGKPNRRGLSLILYMEWLGSWRESYPHYKGTTRADADKEAP
jgi:hypothetical protein